MTRGTVAITSPLPGSIAAILDGHDVRVAPTPPAGAGELTDFLRDADAAITLLSDPVTAEVIESCDDLRIIANYAVGYDNIDLAAARTRGVIVTNTPGVLTAATADLTMALILATTRRILEGHRLIVSGGFTGWSPSLLLGSSLEGKTLGIVGMGRIGADVARRAEAFGMNVRYYSRSGVKPGAPGKSIELDELTAVSDVISIHAPLNQESRNLFDRDRLSRMKKGAFLINTARGPIVDESALAAALRSGHLAGAGLDVFEREPEVHPNLMELDNVVLLPHLGSATTETRREMARMVANDVALVLAGQPPLHPVPGQNSSV